MAQYTVWKQWLWSQLVVFPDKDHSFSGESLILFFAWELIHSLLIILNDRSLWPTIHCCFVLDLYITILCR